MACEKTAAEDLQVQQIFFPKKKSKEIGCELLKCKMKIVAHKLKRV